MDIQLADERIFLYPPRLKQAEAEDQAWAKKLDAFGTVNKVASFLQKPKDEDFELNYQEFRFQPFWYLKYHSRYVYDRGANYHVPTQGPEVQAVTLMDQKNSVSSGHFDLKVTEHCTQEEEKDVFVGGLTSAKDPSLKQYFDYQAKEHLPDSLATAVPDGAIIVPPEAKASAIVRESLGKMIRAIKADQIFEESVRVEHIDLYYHPVYAFQFTWKSKQKTALIEIDALTGSLQTGQKTFKQYLGKALDAQFLFDVGADAAGMVIPGGSIAVKLAKKVIDRKLETKKQR